MPKRGIVLATATCVTVLLANRYTSTDSLRAIVERGMIAPGSN